MRLSRSTLRVNRPLRSCSPYLVQTSACSVSKRVVADQSGSVLSAVSDRKNALLPVSYPSTSRTSTAICASKHGRALGRLLTIPCQLECGDIMQELFVAESLRCGVRCCAWHRVSDHSLVGSRPNDTTHAHAKIFAVPNAESESGAMRNCS